MVKATKDSYKCVYKPDGTYSYPKVPVNLLRKKDQEYFENWEITGSRDCDKQGKSKFPLTMWLKDNLMPALMELSQRLATQLGKKIHVRGQWDNATPHRESGLLSLIGELFGEHGWEWTMQPANTPLSNVMDAAIFPALAKVGTALQGIMNGGRYLQCEKIWEVLEKAWNEYPEDKIVRAFVHHAQVAAALFECNGGDDFVKERNGLSFGVRKVCRPYYGDNDTGEEDSLDLSSLAPRQLADAKGVVVEEIFDGVDIDSAAVKKLKYDLPDMQQHNISEYLSYNELDLIAGDPEAVDYDNMTEEEKNRYNKFVEAWYAKCDKEERLT